LNGAESTLKKTAPEVLLCVDSREWSGEENEVSLPLNSLNSSVLSFSRLCRSPICLYKQHKQIAKTKTIDQSLDSRERTFLTLQDPNTH